MTKPGSPHWGGVVARIFAFTFLTTLLTFAVALFVSIIGTVIYARLKHVSPNLMYAYKHIAFPIAVIGGASSVDYHGDHRTAKPAAE